MTLLSVRTLFTQLSGRYDLVQTVDENEFSNNGADKYIQAGQDMLDRMANFKFSPKRIYKSLESGIWYATFYRCRALKEVWVSNATARYELVKKSFHEIRDYYGTPFGSIEDERSEDSLYYAPCVSLLGPGADDQTVLTIDNFGGTSTTTADSTYTYNAIVVAPPFAEDVTLELLGLFYSNYLSADTDRSVWTEMHEMILVWAALYMLEVSYRNTNGAKDWYEAISREIISLDMDGVEEDITGVDQIED